MLRMYVQVALFHLHSHLLHFLQGLKMPLMSDISKALRKYMYLESCLVQVCACILYAVLCRYAAHIYVSRVKQLQDFSQRLLCIIHALESGVLFHSFVASLIEGQLFLDIRRQSLMYLASVGAGYAMCRPDAALCFEGRMVCRMVWKSSP